MVVSFERDHSDAPSGRRAPHWVTPSRLGVVGFVRVRVG